MGHCDEVRRIQYLTILTDNVLSNSFLIWIMITWLSPQRAVEKKYCCDDLYNYKIGSNMRWPLIKMLAKKRHIDIKMALS